MIISFQRFRFFIAAIRFVALRFVSFSSMFCRIVPEQDFVGCFIMAHHMTCQTKTPLSHDGGDPWEEAVQFLVGHVVAP